MGMVRFRGRDWVKSIYLDSNVDPGSTKDVDPGTCLTSYVFLFIFLRNFRRKF